MLLNDASFGDSELAHILSDKSYIQTLVEVEIALARAEARHYVIPANAAEQIAKTQVEQIDLQTLVDGSVESGFPIIALVKELRRLAGPNAAQYVHWGATTQDIMDTAAVLQIRSIVELFKARLREIAQNLGDLAQRHRATVMAGRTHGQQAVPISFGLKAANWLAPLIRHSERLDEIAPRLFVVQCGGAAGTLAGIGEKGLAVAVTLADELRLHTPIAPWHTQRDNFLEFAGWLSLVAGTLGKMAQDIILLSQTEVGEVSESAEEDRGGSSTMPQKRNPIVSELILAAARTNAALLSALHQAQIQEHERATHGWQVEWLTLPQMMTLTGASLRHAMHLSRNLQVDAAAMLRNIARANDVVLGETAVFTLAKAMPRHTAEKLVKNACRIATTEGKPLIDVLRQLSPDTPIDWTALAAPANYLGETTTIIDRILQGAADCFGKRLTE